MSKTAFLLVPISAGELIDKITILRIKQERITDTAKLANVERELTALEEIRSSSISASPELDEMFHALQSINAALWQIEDDIRACEARQDFGSAFVKLARAVYHRNDERAALKRRTNLLFGSPLVEEKQYAAYR